MAASTMFRGLSKCAQRMKRKSNWQNLVRVDLTVFNGFDFRAEQDSLRFTEKGTIHEAIGIPKRPFPWFQIRAASRPDVLSMFDSN
jgi:hypothetical protein